MKKILGIMIVCCLLTISAVCNAESYNLFDMYQKPDSKGDTIPQTNRTLLYNKYPLVGVGAAGTHFYLDTSSCTWYQEGDKFIIACIVQLTASKVTSENSPGIIKSITFKFNVIKNSNDFLATLNSINDSDKLIQSYLDRDNGFLRFLLLQAVKYSNYPAAKIQALNREAEAQLKANADAEEAEYQRQLAEKRAREAAAARQSQPQYQSYDGVCIGNVNSRIFYRANCPSVSRMKASNRVSIGSREEAISRGYTPCQRCRP